MSNIRDRANYFRQAWEWEWLNPAFVDENGRQGRASDIDGWESAGLIEQWGHLLLLESKPLDWEWGERDAQLRRMVTFAAKPGQVALILYGSNPEDPVVSWVQVAYAGRFGMSRPATNEMVVRWCSRWFAHARSGCHAPTCTWENR